MNRKNPNREKVATAIRDLCLKTDPAKILFVIWYTPLEIADKTGLSIDTARRQLNSLCQYAPRKYARRRFGGNRYGYRYRVQESDR